VQLYAELLALVVAQMGVLIHVRHLVLQLVQYLALMHRVLVTVRLDVRHRVMVDVLMVVRLVVMDVHQHVQLTVM
jgi:hypothetical protein